MSWSDWLQSFKGSISGKKSSRKDNNEKISHDSSGSSQNQSLSKLYPEEGISEEIVTEVDGNFNYQTASSQSSPYINSPIQYTHSFMSRGQPGLSSTPIYGHSSSMNEVLTDPLMSQPSTSGECGNHVHPTKEDSLTLLKKSFNNSDSDPIYQPSTSSNFNSNTRKRLRDSVDKGNDYLEYQQTSRESKIPRTRTPMSVKDDSDTSDQDLGRVKRPRFSISAFGSPIFGKTSDKSMNDDPSFSLFYPGKIMFGGASNHQVKRCRIIPRKVTPRSVSKKEPSAIEESSDGGLSMAAKRILSCIDKISTPLSSSKQIPLNQSRDFNFSLPFESEFHKNRPVLKSKIKASAASPLPPPATKLLTPSKALTHIAVSGFITQNSKSFQSDSLMSKNRHQESMDDEGTRKDNDVHKTVDSSQSLSIPCSTKSTKFQNDKVVTISDNTHKTTPIDKSYITTWKKAIDSHVEITTSLSNNNPPTSSNCERKFTFSIPNTLLLNNSPSSDIPSSSLKFTFSEALKVDSSQPVESSFGNWPSKFKACENSWECDTCLLSNSNSDKCVACEAPKPKSKVDNKNVSTPSSLSVDPFTTQKSYWECDVCLIQNKVDATSCIACSNPNKEVEKSIATSSKPEIIITNSWGDAFTKKSDTWDCQVCLIQNESTCNKCVACETEKPTTSSVSSQNTIASSFATTPFQSSFNGFGDQFKAKEGSWDCSVCLIQNDGKLSKCAACETAKPKEHSTDKSVVQTTFSSPVLSSTVNESNKTLPTGKLDNILANKENSGIVSNKKVSIPGKNANEVKKQWECKTCLVRNNPSLKKCISCDSPKISSDPSSIVSAALTGNFKFGVNTKTSAQTVLLPAFSSALPIKAFDITSKDSLTTIPSSSNSSFNFSSSFTNQTSTTSAASVSLAFSFNAKPTHNSVFSSSTVTSNPVVSFPSMTSISRSSTSNLSSVSSVIPMSSSTSSDTKLTFQFSKTNLPSKSVGESTLQFPSFDKIPTSVSKTFITEVNDESTKKANPVSFNFFDKSKPEETLSSTQTSNSTENATTLFSNPKPSSVFSFGQSNSNNNNHDNNKVSTGFSFGQSASKPSFSFGNSASSQPVFQFGQLTNSASATQFKAGDPPTPAAFMSMEAAPKTNNPFSTATVGGQRRIIKRAIRRSNKP